jgi:predicted RecA/RadA family phage recombinase
MAVIKNDDHFVNDYKVGEGNMIGALQAEFGENQAIDQKIIKAGADVKKGQVVEVTGDAIVSPTTGASAKVLGVAMFDAKAGEEVSVETEGLFKMVASGTIAAGSKVASAKDGKVASGTENTIGIAITSATADEYVYVKFSI